MKYIGIESGHGKSWWGGKDNGACYNGATERDINVAISRHLIDRLQKSVKGINILGIGVETEANLSAKTKYVNTVAKMNGLKKDDFLTISIHCNASADKRAQGTETWISAKTSAAYMSLASMIDENIAKMQIVNRGVKQTINHRYGKLYTDDWNSNSLLIETAFISNPADFELLGSTRGRIQIADAIADAIIKFLNK